MRRGRTALIAGLLAMFHLTSVSATIITEFVYPPQLVQSPDARSRFTVTDICQDNVWLFQLDGPYVPGRPVGEQQYMAACLSSQSVFIGEFTARNDDGTWRVLWTKPLPDGFSAADWLMDEDANLLATLWFDSKDHVHKVLVFNRNGDLLRAYRIDVILRDAGLPWQGSIASPSYWQFRVRFTDDHLALQIDVIPGLKLVWEQPSIPLHAELSLSDGRLSLTDPERWAFVRREMECRLMVHHAAEHANNPDVVWNDKGEGVFVEHPLPIVIWEKINAELAASIAPTKAKILFGLGLPCRRATDGSAPP